MSDLEQKIKELERQLNLKKAYQEVSFSFTKASKLPEDVKEEVKAALAAVCLKLADEKENLPELNPNHTSFFSEEEVHLLKEFAAAVKAKQPAKVENSAKKATITRSVKEELPASKATVLTLDNVQDSVRKRMGSNEEVEVVSVRENLVRVVNKHGQTFSIPIDDLDFNL